MNKFKIRLRHLVLILALIGLLLYIPSFNNDFVWDDEEQIITNQAVHSVLNIPQLFYGSTFNSGGTASLGGLYYKPLMSVSFSILYSISHGTPALFHIFQFLLHLGSTIFILLIFSKIFRHQQNKLIAFAFALIFLVHPLNVETVTYISSLQDTLFMFFGLAGFAWVTYFKKLLWYDYLMVSTFLLLAFLGKETGLLFIPIIFSYFLIKKSFKQAIIWGFWSLLPLGIYSYLRFIIAQVFFQKNLFTPIATLPLLERLKSAPLITWHYFSNFIYPDKLAISQHWVVTEVTLTNFYLPLLFMLFILVTPLIYFFRTRSKTFLFFYSWFVIGLSLHLHFFPLDLTVTDRWFYLPMIGILGMMADVFNMQHRKNKKFLIIFLLLLSLPLFIRSSIRLGNWENGLTLYEHDIKMIPDSFDLNNNYGVELVRDGQIKKAKPYFQKSTEIAPSWWTNWNNLGVVIEKEGNLPLAEEYYLKAINNGNYYLAYGNYARVLLIQEKNEQAIQFIAESLRVLPYNQELRDLKQYALSLE